MSVPFLPYKFNYNSEVSKWLITHPNATLQGTDFFIVCDSQDDAKKLTDQLNDGKIKRPTEDPIPYEIIREYTPMDGRLFWRLK